MLCVKHCSIGVEHGLQDVLIGVWVELVAVTLVEFVVEFHPVQTDCVQEAFQHVHAHKYRERHTPEAWPENQCHKCSNNTIFLSENVVSEDEIEEGNSQLGVCEGKGPQSQIRSCVGNGTEGKFNGLDHLMNEDLTEGVTSVIFHSHFLELIF